MRKYSIIFGIDVSKDILDIYEINSTSENELFQIKNKTSDITKWLKTMNSKDTLCVLEPTGCYSQRLLNYLNKYKIATALVPPGQSCGFTNALGIISKNDSQAAKTLALMGQRLDLTLYKHPSTDMQNRKQLLMAKNALMKQKQMLKNQLHAFEHQIVFAPVAVDALKQTLSTVTEQIEVLEEQLNDLDDDEYEHQLKLIRTVVGIGPKTAQALLVATGGIQNFNHARQLSKFLGLVPSSQSSGSSVFKKGRMTKKGNGLVRACLYMAARSARRHNNSCKELYERLRSSGKSHKVASVAVMHKLVKQVFGVVHSGNIFDNQFYLKFKKN